MSRPTPLGRLRGRWDWFVDGLVEALLWAGRRGRAPAPFSLLVGETEGTIVGPDGTPLGRLAPIDAAMSFAPHDLLRRLAGRDLDVVIPRAWMFRRNLDPVAAESRPFLDAFVRHQIERITPWRSETVYHQVLTSLLPDDPSRLAVVVVIVPKRLVDEWLAPLRALQLATLRLRTDDGAETTIPISGGEAPGTATLRRGVTWGLAGLCLATVLLCGVLEWQASVVATDVEEQRRVLDERKVVLAKARRRESAGDERSMRLLQLRDGRALAVAILDALAQAVPDSAHLTALSIEKDHVAISGLSTDPSALVPALEKSGRFADVASSAATTRIETGDADRFALSMLALTPAAGPTAHASRRPSP